MTKFPSNGLPKHLVRHALRHSFQVLIIKPLLQVFTVISNSFPFNILTHLSIIWYQVWSRHADIDFVEKDSGQVDLEIRLHTFQLIHVFKIITIKSAHLSDGSPVDICTASPWTVEEAPLHMLIFPTR